MKFKTTCTLIVVIFLFIKCSKENVNNHQDLQTLQVSNAKKPPVDSPSIPLNDLGAGSFKGYIGGLYPGGLNTPPSGTYADDLFATCSGIIPIDTFGNPSLSGKIVFISLGGSTGGHNMRNLKAKTEGNPLTNPNLLLLNCDNGKRTASLNSQMNPNDPYWNHVTQILTGGAHSSYRQVQVIYVEADDSTKKDITFPNRPILVKQDLQQCFRVYKQKFPNVKIVYLLARTKTFGNQELFNREPSPYYFGWSCKWAIEDQINGVPGTEYKGQNPVSPLITWGFYQWADSLPRKTDQFYWRFSETKDGLHANDVGGDTLSTRFQNFLLTDPNASIWYAAH